MDDFIADGAFHEHEVKFAFFLFHCVLFSRLATHQAHCGVRQHWLQGGENTREVSMARTPWGTFFICLNRVLLPLDLLGKPGMDSSSSFLSYQHLTVLGKNLLSVT